MNIKTTLAITVAWMALLFSFSSTPSFSTGDITQVVLKTLDQLSALQPEWLRGHSPISADSYQCLNTVIRKIGHFAAYQVLAVLLLKIFLSIKKTRHPYLLSALVAIAFAFFDELYQSTVPNRNPLLVDVMVDTAGVLTALVLARLAASSHSS